MTTTTKDEPGKEAEISAIVPEEITINGVEYVLIPKEEFYASDAELVEIMDDILEREESSARPFDEVAREIFGEKA